MPQRTHLRRLENVWIKNPLYFVSVCCKKRQSILICPQAADIVLRSWHDAPRIHGWAVGKYVIMPDHVHFFCRDQSGAKPLPAFIRDWKKWTTKQINAAIPITPPLWQSEFFDHVIRSADSYSEKWAYVQANPSRAGLVNDATEWPHTGEIAPLVF